MKMVSRSTVRLVLAVGLAALATACAVAKSTPGEDPRSGTNASIVTWADGTEYDLGGQWARISMYDSLSEAAGRAITPETPLAELKALADAEGVEVPEKVATHGGRWSPQRWRCMLRAARLPSATACSR